MYFDSYGTSLQSLYKPTYNASFNYSMGAYPGTGYPMMNMGYDPLMQGVGIGQFGSHLVSHIDDSKKNYYAKPVAPHKRNVDSGMGTALGITATALATLAAIGLACKGKVFKKPTPTPTPVPPTPTPVPPTPIPGPKPTPNPGPGPNPAPPTPAPVPPTPIPGPKPITDPTRLLPPHQPTPGPKPTPNPGPGPNPAPPTPAPWFEIEKPITNPSRLLPAHVQGETIVPQQSTRWQDAEARLAAAMKGQPTGEVIQLPAKGSYITPEWSFRNNRFANINGIKIENAFQNIGLNINTKALAQLPNNLRRQLNNLVLSGDTNGLKALTCDYRFEHLFRVI